MWKCKAGSGTSLFNEIGNQGNQIESKQPFLYRRFYNNAPGSSPLQLYLSIVKPNIGPLT